MRLRHDAPTLLLNAVERPMLGSDDWRYLLDCEKVRVDQMPVLDGLIRREAQLQVQHWGRNASQVTAMGQGYCAFKAWQVKHAREAAKAARKAAERDWHEKEIGRALLGSQTQNLGFEIWHPTTNRRLASVEEFRAETRRSGGEEIGNLHLQDVLAGTLKVTGTEVTSQEVKVIQDKVRQQREVIAKNRGRLVARTG